MKRAEWILPCMVLLLAAWPRFSHLSERGAFYHDEAITLQNGRYYGALVRSVFHQISQGKVSGRSLTAEAKRQWELGGTPSLHARPLHEGAVILLNLLGGESDTWALLFSALCGLISVWLVARMGDHGPLRTGLIAASLLAFSAWHIHYSRSAVSASLSLLMALLTLRAVLKFDSHHPEKSAAWAGFWSGLAILSHYNLFWLPWFAGFGACMHLRGLPWQRWARSLSILAGASLIPAFLLEGLWRQFRYMLGWAFRADTVSPLQNFPPYFEQLYAKVFNITTFEERHPLSPLFLPRVLFDLETFPFFLLLLSGFSWLAYRAAKRDVHSFLLLAFALIPGLIWSLFGYHGPRSFIPILPVLCLGAGEPIAIALVHARRFGRPGLALFSVLALALFSWQGKSLLPLIHARSPWKEAAAWILRTRPELDFADGEFSIYNRPLFRYYLGDRVDKNADSGSALILDPTAWEFPYGRHSHWETMRREGIRIHEIGLNLTQGMVLLDPFSSDFISSELSGENPTLTLYVRAPEKKLP